MSAHSPLLPSEQTALPSEMNVAARTSWMFSAAWPASVSSRLRTTSRPKRRHVRGQGSHANSTLEARRHRSAAISRDACASARGMRSTRPLLSERESLRMRCSVRSGCSRTWPSFGRPSPSFTRCGSKWSSAVELLTPRRRLSAQSMKQSASSLVGASEEQIRRAAGHWPEVTSRASRSGTPNRVLRVHRLMCWTSWEREAASMCIQEASWSLLSPAFIGAVAKLLAE